MRLHGAGRDFNPRAPRGARQALYIEDYDGEEISIHAPREGRDRKSAYRKRKSVTISIHAPREGRDADGQPLVLHREHFNPRAPRGARPLAQIARPRRPIISIHAPREGRDPNPYSSCHPNSISIHAPREGRDAVGTVIAAADIISIHAPREGRDDKHCNGYTGH